jgi:hypothetical protein
MAELYAQQGHRAAAIEIYRQLSESDPDNEELSARLAELSTRQTPSSEAPAVTAHFTETELDDGDTWDTDVWGAGFSAEDSAVAEAFAEPDVESAPAPGEKEVAQPVAEQPAAEPADEVSVGEATGDEDYLAAIPTEESFAAEESRGAETPAEELRPEEPSKEAPPPEPVYAEPAGDSDIVAYAPPVPDVDEAEAITAESALEGISVASQPVADLGEEAQPAPAPESRHAPTTEAPRGRTVREFFATLGARKPPEIPDRIDPSIAEDTASSDRAVSPPGAPEARVESREYPLADDAFASLFAGAPVSPEDSRAAAVLSAAVAHPPRKTPSPTVPRPAVVTAPGEVHESEEDIKRFREWLDGLTES